MPCHEIKPHPGPQTSFFESNADIVIFGGGAGPGKTFALLMEPLRHIENPKFGAVIFRRESPQITNEGGLWDEASGMYPAVGGRPRGGSDLDFRFRIKGSPGGRVSFRHLQHENDKYKWQGSQIPLLMFDELTHFCYNAVMETLTESGWRRISDVKPGEKVLALTSDGIARYEDVTAAWSYDFDGDMHETTNRSVRYSVTPNHKMVIRRQGYEGWQFCEAKDLDKYPRFPFDSEWGGDEREWVEFPATSGRGIGPNQNSVTRIAADIYLEFLGWYLSEGSSFLSSRKRNASPCVSIRQTKTCPELHALMARFPLRSRFVEGDGYRVFSKQLHDHFKPLGNLYQKRVPRWVMNLSRRQLRLVFDAFTLGDGQRLENGAIDFGLANEGLVDDMQEIAAKLGHRSTKAVGKGGKGNAYVVHRLYVHARTGGLVHDRPENKRTVPYKGKVYCLTVEPSHTLLVRHEGRVSWSGNSESQFFYMLSRNRSMCGVKPYVRATTNPDASSWVKRLLAPWVDRKFKGKKAASGEVRWFIRFKGKIEWGMSAEDIAERFGPNARPKSITFIRATIWDNPTLLKKDPEYLANLQAQTPVERARLLEGDWDIVNEGLTYPDFGTCVVEVEDWPADLTGRAIGGIDWGFRDPFVALKATEDSLGTIWVEWELYDERLTPTMISKQLPRDPDNPPRWWADPSQPTLIAELRHADHDIIACTHLGSKPIKSGVATVTERISEGSLKIKGDLGNLIDEAGKYRYPEEGKGDPEIPVDKDNHAMDALRYLIVGNDRGRVVRDKAPPESEERREAREEAEAKVVEELKDEFYDIDNEHWWRQ